MLDKYRKQRKSETFSRAIAGILDTPPVSLGHRQVTIVSMVSNRDVPMYLLALKSIFAVLQPNRVIAVIDRDMPGELRQTLQAHILGIEFTILEDIETAPCQRGGTWERLLYCIDCSVTDYVIQIDADCLFVGAEMDDVVACIESNRAFTMTDGQQLVTFPQAAEFARRTPSDYMGILSERAFDRFPEAEKWRYIRGSSGFAGFAKGGITRTEINHFHVQMQQLVGETLWKKWGSEQCGSNFAVANSPDPVILPHPAYTSFPPHGPRWMCKFYHFIGASRYREGYYVQVGNRLIAEWTGRAVAAEPPDRVWPPAHERLLPLSRSLTPDSVARSATWQLTGGAAPVVLRQRDLAVWEWHDRPGPRFELRAGTVGREDLAAAERVFVRNALFPPGWIPPERVDLVVDLDAGAGMSALFWLANYPFCRLIAHAADPAQMARNAELNGWTDRLTVLADGNPASVAAAVAGRRIDILKAPGRVGLDDGRALPFSAGASVTTWPAQDGAWREAKRMAAERGAVCVDFAEPGGSHVLWVYAVAEAPADANSRESSCSVSAAQ